MNQSCAAVLFVPVKDEGPPAVQRMMAISFGTGHHALDPDAFERGFGLRVVLNSVARSRLRSVDIATLDATTFLKRFSPKAGKSPLDTDCVVGLGGLEPGAKHAVVSNESLAPTSAAIKCRSIDLRSVSERTGNRS